jgi:hypothetical protein
LPTGLPEASVEQLRVLRPEEEEVPVLAAAAVLAVAAEAAEEETVAEGVVGLQLSQLRRRKLLPFPRLRQET